MHVRDCRRVAPSDLGCEACKRLQSSRGTRQIRLPRRTVSCVTARTHPSRTDQKIRSADPYQRHRNVAARSPPLCVCTDEQTHSHAGSGAARSWLTIEMAWRLHLTALAMVCTETTAGTGLTRLNGCREMRDDELQLLFVVSRRRLRASSPRLPRRL